MFSDATPREPVRYDRRNVDRRVTCSPKLLSPTSAHESNSSAGTVNSTAGQVSRHIKNTSGGGTVAFRYVYRSDGYKILINPFPAVAGVHPTSSSDRRDDSHRPSDRARAFSLARRHRTTVPRPARFANLVGGDDFPPNGRPLPLCSFVRTSGFESSFTLRALPVKRFLVFTDQRSSNILAEKTSCTTIIV